MKACIICATGLEECEALLTYDILFRSGIEVELLGLEKEITSSHNVTFKTHKLLKEVNIMDYDCLALPGGMPGTINLEASKDVLEAIDLFVKSDKYIAAVCAAPSILAHKGLLEDNHFTCFPGFESGLISTGEKAVCHKKIITGKGLGATIEFASLIVEKLLNKTKSNEVKNKIQY